MLPKSKRIFPWILENCRAGRDPRDHLLGWEAEDPSGGVTCPIPWQWGCFDLLSPDDVLLGKDCKLGKDRKAACGRWWSMLRNVHISPSCEYIHAWLKCIYRKVGLKPRKTVDLKPAGFAPTVKKTKWSSLFTKPSLPSWLIPGPPYCITPGAPTHTVPLIRILERQKSKNANVSYYFSCSSLTAGTEPFIDNYRTH